MWIHSPLSFWAAFHINYPTKIIAFYSLKSPDNGILQNPLVICTRVSRFLYWGTFPLWSPILPAAWPFHLVPRGPAVPPEFVHCLKSLAVCCEGGCGQQPPGLADSAPAARATPSRAPVLKREHKRTESVSSGRATTVF